MLKSSSSHGFKRLMVIQGCRQEAGTHRAGACLYSIYGRQSDIKTYILYVSFSNSSSRIESIKHEHQLSCLRIFTAALSVKVKYWEEQGVARVDDPASMPWSASKQSSLHGLTCRDVPDSPLKERQASHGIHRPLSHLLEKRIKCEKMREKEGTSVHKLKGIF